MGSWIVHVRMNRKPLWIIDNSPVLNVNIYMKTEEKAAGCLISSKSLMYFLK